MNIIRTLLPAFAILLLSSGLAFADNAPLKKLDGVMVNAAGLTVYTFDQDTAGSGKSVCNGACISIWPAVAAAPGEPPVPYSVVTRDDGARQLAYKGKPLYLYAADQKPGDRNGDNFKNVWHIVKD